MPAARRLGRSWSAIGAARLGLGSALGVLLLAPALAGAAQIPGLDAPAEAPAAVLADGWRFDWGLETRAHFRDSESASFPLAFPFTPPMLPPGQSVGLLETVEPGTHFEVSVVTLTLDAGFGETFEAHAKIDVIDLHERNPTSDDRELDLDEAWVRFGREVEPAREAEGFGAYAKLGKFGHFERQDDRHLESYGLVSNAFNRLEDAGLELGFDLGSHLYMKASATQGNPLFIRDPNALAGDNGTAVLRRPNPDPERGSGIVILYDAEVEDLDFEHLELGLGLGWRWEDDSGLGGGDLLLWAYRRDLAETVDFEGTFYGGDLDLLLGPGNAFPLPVTDAEKQEVGANFWFYRGGFSLFVQAVAQKVAGMDRDGLEVELAHRFDLPLRWAIAGRQLFPYVAPAVRYSELDPDFDGGDPRYPAPSVRWEWRKLDVGLRFGLVSGLDLTLEYADNELTLGSGRRASNDELLTTLRWRL